MARHGTCELLKRHTSSRHFLKIHVDVKIDHRARLSYTIGEHCLTYSIGYSGMSLDWEYADICIRVSRHIGGEITGIIFRTNPTRDIWHFDVDSDNVWHCLMLNYKRVFIEWNR